MSVPQAFTSLSTDKKQLSITEKGLRDMTNGDRIRQMTDEELAESLSGSVACKHVASCLDTSCYECTLEWIKQEVKTDDER